MIEWSKVTKDIRNYAKSVLKEDSITITDAEIEDARCDFAPNRVQISFRSPEFGIISFWKKSLYDRILAEIKSDDNMVCSLPRE